MLDAAPMQEEAYALGGYLGSGESIAPVSSRSGFSCSPRDFLLPLAPLDAEAEPTPDMRPVARRPGARRKNVALRDKNKDRVAELLLEERAPDAYEMASEARLQRYLVGDTAAENPRRVRCPSRSEMWEVTPHRDARVSSLFGTSFSSLAEECDDTDDLFASIHGPIDPCEHDGSDISELEEDLRSSPGIIEESAEAAVAMSPRLGLKRKCEDDAPISKRKVPGGRLQTRRPTPVRFAPATSPLSTSPCARRAATPGLPAGSHAPDESPLSLPSTPIFPAWAHKQLAQSPASSGPGYGSGAIGLRLGVRGPVDTVFRHVAGLDMDEGVRALGLG